MGCTCDYAASWNPTHSGYSCDIDNDNDVDFWDLRKFKGQWKIEKDW